MVERRAAACFLFFLLLLMPVWPQPVSAQSVVARPELQQRALTVLTSAAPTTLDPSLALTGADFQVLGHVYDTLAGRDMFTPVPGLLSEWASTDQRLWRLQVAPGRRFSDGRPVTARDVAYSICRWAAVNVQAQGLGLRQATMSVDGVVLMELSQPKANLVSALLLIFGVPAPAAMAGNGCTPDQALVRHAPTGQAVGSGPYLLAEANGRREFRLVASGVPQGLAVAFSEVRLQVEPDALARVRALTEGRADLIEDPPPAPLAYLSGLPHLGLTELPTDRTLLLSINQANPVLADVRVRRAIALAIDKGLLAARATDGYGTPANQLGIKGMKGFDADRAPDRYDPAAARAMLREAGVKEGLTLDLLVAPTRGSDGGRSADVIAGMLSAVGIRAQIVRLSPEERRERLAQGRFDLTLALIGIEDGIVFSGFESMLRSSLRPNILNPSGYANPEISRLIDDALTNPAAIPVATAAIQRVLDADVPFITLLHLRDVVLHRSDLVIMANDSARVFGRTTGTATGANVQQ